MNYWVRFEVMRFVAEPFGTKEFDDIILISFYFLYPL